MSKKDLTYLILAAIIFSVAGILGYNQIFAKKKPPQEVTVEVIEPISAEFDANALTIIADATKVRDFSFPIDITTGLGNPTPFNPL